VIAPGETVIMSTDGIAEARRDNEFFGLEGIAEAAKTTGPQAPLNQLVQAIYNSARDFARNLMRDDVCLLLARRN
jgi:serine phosphatase RsbU (regulator of sigma subunit)